LIQARFQPTDLPVRCVDQDQHRVVIAAVAGRGTPMSCGAPASRTSSSPATGHDAPALPASRPMEIPRKFLGKCRQFVGALGGLRRRCRPLCSMFDFLNSKKAAPPRKRPHVCTFTRTADFRYRRRAFAPLPPPQLRVAQGAEAPSPPGPHIAPSREPSVRLEAPAHHGASPVCPC